MEAMQHYACFVAYAIYIEIRGTPPERDLYRAAESTAQAFLYLESMEFVTTISDETVKLCRSSFALHAVCRTRGDGSNGCTCKPQ